MFINELDNTYGNLLVVSKGKIDKRGATWNCKCLCGTVKEVLATNLRNGSTKSCGCKSGGGHVKGLNGRQRIHRLNDNFFSEEDLKSYYWAGFIAADGCISKVRNSFSITLALKDYQHLESLKQDLEASNPIILKTDRNYPIARIYVTSQKLKQDLITKFNVVPAKSLVLKYPKFNNRKKEDSFILGYIDGDGYVQHAIKPRIQILGTEDFLKGIQGRFKEILNLDYLYLKPKEGTKIYNLVIHGKNARVIFNHYKILEVPKLQRKWEDQENIYKLK